MQINRVYFRGFGRWTDKEFEFGEGMNVIEAPNEEGKSTLLQGLFALLYGPKKEGVQKQVKADWYQQYIPWGKNEYGGEVDYLVHDQSYRLVRTLFLPQDRAQLNDLNRGMDITTEYPMDNRKERLFIEGQVGLSCEMLKRISFLSPGFQHRGKGEDEKQSQLIERMKVALQGQYLDIHPVIKVLEKQIQEIGNHKSTKKYGLIRARYMELEKEVHQLKIDYQINAENLRKLALLADQIDRLEARKEKLEQDRRCDAVYRLRAKMKELDQQRERLDRVYQSVRSLDEREAYQKMDLMEELIQLEERYAERDVSASVEKDAWRFIEADMAELIRLEERYRECESHLGRIEHQRKLGLVAHRDWWLRVCMVGGILGVVLLAVFFLGYPAMAVFLFVILGCVFYFYSRGIFLAHATERGGLEREKGHVEKELETNSSIQSGLLREWSVDSLALLYDKASQMRRDREDRDMIEVVNRDRRMEEIHQEVHVWLSRFSDDVPLFSPDVWMDRIRYYIQQSREYRSQCSELGVRREGLQRELSTYHSGGDIDYKRGDQDIEKIHSDYIDTEAEWIEKKEERAKLEGRIERTAEHVAILSEKETELDRLKKESMELELERTACELAREGLLEVMTELQQNMGPLLTPYASEYLQRLSCGRYRELLIHVNKGIDIRVYVPETGENTSVYALSRGTIDQIIFALRLSLIRFYRDQAGVFLPVIMDDYFAHFDEMRLRSALCLLNEFASNHQVILSTCHRRERQIMDDLGIMYHRVPI